MQVGDVTELMLKHKTDYCGPNRTGKSPLSEKQRFSYSEIYSFWYKWRPNKDDLFLVRFEKVYCDLDEAFLVRFSLPVLTFLPLNLSLSCAPLSSFSLRPPRPLHFWPKWKAVHSASQWSVFLSHVNAFTHDPAHSTRQETKLSRKTRWCAHTHTPTQKKRLHCRTGCMCPGIDCKDLTGKENNLQDKKTCASIHIHAALTNISIT